MLINKIKISTLNTQNGYLNIPLSSSFSPETGQYDNIEKNFNLSNNDIINPIIDYEKVKLIPINYTQESPSNSLNVRLHFINDNTWDADSTKLTSIGFTEDDIKNKRKKIGKTFIRLSFFDSNDLKTQNLLYFSTIFLDSDTIYNKYIGGVGIDNLKLEFLCEDPKLSNKIKSFEGFNLYLFKGDVSKTQTKTIYMRVDFNNASNGRSTLFVKNKPMSIAGYTMQQLYGELFLEVKCVYNQTIKKYTYFFSGLGNSTYSDSTDNHIKNSINIDLYQAKVV